MKKTLWTLGVGSLGLLAGCSSDTAPDTSTLIVNSDFESLFGWLPEPLNATLSKEQAHSGAYALKVDADHKYSISFMGPVAQIGAKPFSKIKVSAWSFAGSADAQATLVVAIPDPAVPDKLLLWEGIQLNPQASANKWVAINQEIAVPAKVLPTSTLKAYVWHTKGNTPVYLDDLQISRVP